MNPATKDSPWCVECLTEERDSGTPLLLVGTAEIFVFAIFLVAILVLIKFVVL